MCSSSVFMHRKIADSGFFKLPIGARESEHMSCTRKCDGRSFAASDTAARGWTGAPNRPREAGEVQGSGRLAGCRHRLRTWVVRSAGQAGRRYRLFGAPLLGRAACAGPLGAARRATVAMTRTASGEPAPSGRWCPAAVSSDVGAGANGRLGSCTAARASFGGLGQPGEGHRTWEAGRRIGDSSGADDLRVAGAVARKASARRVATAGRRGRFGGGVARPGEGRRFNSRALAGRELGAQPRRRSGPLADRCRGTGRCGGRPPTGSGSARATGYAG